MKNALILLALLLMAASCSKQTTTKTDAKSAVSDVAYYTCTMHPSVRSTVPGKCPICGMELVPVRKTDALTLADTNTAEKPSLFLVPVDRQQQIGVTFATVEKRALQKSIRTVGVVTYDKQRHWDFVSRVDGYVGQLDIASRGDPVTQGQPLLTLYSPALLTTEKEFLDLLRLRDEARQSHSDAALQSAERLLAAGADRLRLWNITTNQIAELEKSGKASETLTLYSPFKGFVQDLLVDQGRRVSIGDHLVDVADLSVVWVWAQCYQEDLPFLKQGMEATVTGDALNGETFAGKIAVIDPFLNDATRAVRVRIDLDNPQQKLLPEMYVNVVLKSAPIEGLSVPVSAVLPTGERDIVFIDKGGGKLLPAFVELGGEYGGYYAVKSGLEAGQRIVNSANFLIDAEAKVQGVLKSW